MKNARLFILISGLLLCGLTIVLLIFSSLFPASYINIALSNIFAVPIVWGFALILVWLLLLKMKLSFFTIVVKSIITFTLISLIMSTLNSPLLVSINDLKAVLKDDLYVVEGVVVETDIERKSFTSSKGYKGKDSFYQKFSIDNDKQDKFTYPVDHHDDYRFKLGHTYRIIALPNSKQLLEYEEINN